MGPDGIRGQDVQLRCADDVALPATVFAPPHVQAVLVIASAMGVPRQFYRRCAAALAGRGIGVLTFDYRGIGDAAAAPADPGRVRLEDWGRLDLHAALAEARHRWPQAPPFLLGHSVGCQLAGFSPLAESLAGLVFVGCSAPNRRHWRGVGRLAMGIWMHLIVPLGSRGRWFPARRLRFSTLDIPAGVTRQWGAWSRSAGYLFDPRHGLETARYARIACPGLSYTLSDDGYAPRRTARALLARYERVRFEERYVRPRDVGARAIGHLGFFRESFRDSLWRELGDWLVRRAAPRRGEAA